MMRATRTLAVVCGLVSALASACGPGASGDDAMVEYGRADALAVGAVAIWDDALGAGWADWSWGSTRTSIASPVRSGTAALSATFQTWGGLYFRRTAGAVSGMSSLDLYANGGTSAGNRIAVQAVQGSTSLPAVSLSKYCDGGTVPAGAWTHCNVPLTALAPAGTAIDGIILQEVDGAARPAMYFDAVALLPAAAPPPPPPVTPPSTGTPVYTDALATGWIDWSWGSTRNLAATSPVASGTRSVAVTFQAWGGFYLRRSAGSVSGATSIDLSMNGGTVAGGSLQIQAVQGSTAGAKLDLSKYCTGAAIPANAWTRCSVPLSALTPAGGAIDGFWIQSASSRATLYLDDIALGGSAATPPPTLPAAPTNLVATVSSGAVSLSWGAVSGATGYVVSRATSSAGPFTALPLASQAGTTYRDATVAAGTTYWYKVAAVNAAGAGASSSAVSVAVPAAPPPPPTTVTVSISPAGATVDACTTARFSATVSGATNQAVTWSVLEGAAGGTVDASGTYTAPATAGTYHLTATSAGGAASASVAVVVRDHVLSVAVNPLSANVSPSQGQQFTATVTTTCGSFTATAQ